MDAEDLYRCYQGLQRYVGWTAEDARRVQAVGAALEPSFPALIDDFYAVIQQHPEAARADDRDHGPPLGAGAAGAAGAPGGRRRRLLQALRRPQAAGGAAAAEPNRGPRVEDRELR